MPFSSDHDHGFRRSKPKTNKHSNLYTALLDNWRKRYEFHLQLPSTSFSELVRFVHFDQLIISFQACNTRVGGRMCSVKDRRVCEQDVRD